MFTPASAYFMRARSLSFRSYLCPGRTRRGGTRRLFSQTSFQQKLKSSKNSVPAHDAGMQQSIRVGIKPFLDLAGLPSFRRNIQRHVNQDRGSDDVFSRNAAPEAAVIGISAIVAHHEITIRGNFERHVLIVGLARASGVFLD